MTNALSEADDFGPLPAPGHNNPPSLIVMLTEQLDQEFGPKLLGADPFAVRATAAPKIIESDEDLATWGGIYLDCKALHTELEKSRLDEKRPLAAAVDGFFKPTVDRLARMMTTAQTLSNVWTRKKAAEETAKRQEEQRKANEAAREAQDRLREAAEFGEPDEVISQHVEAAGAAKAAVDQAAAAKPAVEKVELAGGSSAGARMLWKFEIEDYEKLDLLKLRDFIDQKALSVAVGKYLGIKKEAAKLDGVRFYQEADTAFRR